MSGLSMTSGTSNFATPSTCVTVELLYFDNCEHIIRTY